MLKTNILRKQYTLNDTNYQLKIILYAYHERKDISSRLIEKNCRRDINYMYLLEGKPAPDHATIARFRTKHFAKCSQQILSNMTELLHALGQVTETKIFIDGTKIEASANKYTFVWKKVCHKTPGPASAENSSTGRRYH